MTGEAVADVLALLLAFTANGPDLADRTCRRVSPTAPSPHPSPCVAADRPRATSFTAPNTSGDHSATATRANDAESSPPGSNPSRRPAVVRVSPSRPSRRTSLTQKSSTFPAATPGRCLGGLPIQEPRHRIQSPSESNVADDHGHTCASAHTAPASVQPRWPRDLRAFIGHS